MSSGNGIEFTQYHHALLFTCICKSLMDQAGKDEGSQMIRNGVRQYGKQRGVRMALRAKKNGHPLTVDNYLAYGEWSLPKGLMEFKFSNESPHACLTVFKCPWNDAWQQNNRIDFGCYFCKEIDEALIRGFNPDLEFEVKSTLTNGQDRCRFIFKNGRLSLLEMVSLFYKKKIRPGRSAIMPWEYHSGHLYKTLGLLIKTQRPKDAEEIMEKALSSFAGSFSQAHVDILKRYESVNFQILPY